MPNGAAVRPARVEVESLRDRYPRGRCGERGYVPSATASESRAFSA